MGDQWPTYAQLTRVGSNEEASSWDVFGIDDELGTLNFMSSEATVRALSLVRDGTVIALSRPVDDDTQTLSANRRRLSHTVVVSRGGRDDYVDDYFLQGASQVDSLAHVRYRDLGFYGGRSDQEVDEGALGVDRIARRGIFTRGVLVDVPRFMREAGREWRPDVRFGIQPALLDDVLGYQETKVSTGDLLLVRTGWGAWYDSLSPDDRARLSGALSRGEQGVHSAGLSASPQTVAWLWDARVAAVASDNPAVETLPVRREEGFLHQRLIALLGMPLGELWDLEELARLCADDRRWEFFVTSSPLMLARGAGSPSNAYALR